MDTIHETRRQNLRKLVAEHEGMNNLARKLGLTKGSYISQMLTTPANRTLSEKTARKWERALKLPDGWLDRPVGTAPTLGSTNDVLLAQVVAAVQEEIHQQKVSFGASQLGEFIALQYKDALAAKTVDRNRIRAIVALFKK